jgi:hypothetical protein
MDLYQMAKIRPDITYIDFACPIERNGKTKYISGRKWRESRWLNEGKKNERFQIRYYGKWWDAQSIDYNFK